MKGNPSKDTHESIILHYKRIEESYNRNLQVYQSLFNHNPEAVFSFSLDGKITSANNVMLCKSESTLESILKQEFKDFIEESDKEIAQQLLEEVRNGKVREFQMKFTSSGGKQLDMAIKCLPIYVDGEIIGGYGIATDITSKLKIEFEVKEVIDSLAKAYVEKDNILESITEGFFAIDTGWNFIYCNRVVENIWGLVKQEIVGKNFWDLIDMANAPLILLEFRRAMETRVRVNFEMYYPPFKMWLDITAYPNDNGLSSIVKVINEEKRLERIFNLEKGALELNTNIERSADDIVVYLIDGLQEIHPDMVCSIVKVNKKKLYNWYAPNLPEDYKKLVEGFPIGKNQGSCGTAAYLKETIVVEDISKSAIWDKYKEIAANFGFKACWSMPLFNKNREVFATFAIYYNTVKKPHPAELNSIERVRNILTTILNNKQTEDEILISKERYDIVAKATNDAIFDCDLITRKVIWNNGISSIFGYNPDEVNNRLEWGWSKVHPDDRKKAVAKLAEHLHKGSTAFSDEFRCMNADGTYKYVQNKVFIICDPKTGNATRLIGALQDVTDQKTKELQLRHLNETLEERAQQLAISNTELERFAYVASHDLQEPLRTITSFLQLLKRKYANQLDETAENYINFTVDGADRMKQLIMDMLEYSRVNTQIKLNEEVDMKQVVNEVLFNFSGKIKLSEAVIQVADNLPKIFAVKTQMMQLFQNLIGNGMKYQKPNTSPNIYIGFEERETEWEFYVKDDGIGIEQKYFEKIFIIFQRLHSKTQFSGTGIGLAICKKVIEKHKGRIWVTSVPSEGSTFYFTIPKKNLKEDEQFTTTN